MDRSTSPFDATSTAAEAGRTVIVTGAASGIGVETCGTSRSIC